MILLYNDMCRPIYSISLCVYIRCDLSRSKFNENQSSYCLIDVVRSAFLYYSLWYLYMTCLFIFTDIDVLLGLPDVVQIITNMFKLPHSDVYLTRLGSYPFLYWRMIDWFLLIYIILVYECVPWLSEDVMFMLKLVELIMCSVYLQNCTLLCIHVIDIYAFISFHLHGCLKVILVFHQKNRKRRLSVWYGCMGVLFSMFVEVLDSYCYSFF